MELGPKITVHLIDCCKEVVVSGLATRLLASGPKRKETEREYCMLISHTAGERG